MPTIIIGVDPGRDKCGIAAVSSEETLVREVVPRKSAVSRSVELAVGYSASAIVVGNRTGGRELITEIHRACSAAAGITDVPVVPVEEHLTSQEARKRYWQVTPRRGWRRLVPPSMLVPPEPVDGFVAEILAERYLQNQFSRTR